MKMKVFKSQNDLVNMHNRQEKKIMIHLRGNYPNIRFMTSELG